MFSYTKILTTAPSQRKENRPALEYFLSARYSLAHKEKAGSASGRLRARRSTVGKYGECGLLLPR